MIDAAEERAFGSCPFSWFYVGSISKLAERPTKFELPGSGAYVAFVTATGRPVVLNARCSHMGVDLAQGCVRGENLACSLHGWEYDAGGQCTRIPAAAGKPVPSFARQLSFPVAELGGQVFFFNRPEPRFAAPFFDGVTPDELQPARAFDLHDNVPWYFIGANGFDVQHFRNAHDRILLDDPVVDSPDPYARRITMRLGVAGDTFSDRLTRWFAGPEVAMTVTVWGGTLIFVTARFRRTTTYGLMTVQPVEPAATHARVVVWVHRGRGNQTSRLFDQANAAIRRWFIRQFLRSDLGRMAGARYLPGRLIDADKYFGDYMEWLRQIHR